MNNPANPTEFKLLKAILFPHKGKEIPFTPLVLSFNYGEDVTAPFVSAELEILDSASLLNGNGTNPPIKGGERVQIDVQCINETDAFKYEFVIWQISNRFVRQNKQYYTMSLISGEALQNELTRVPRNMSGNPEAIMGTLLTKDLGTKKPIYSEKSLFDVQLLGNMRRPFDIIGDIAVKCVSSKGDYGQNKTKPSSGTAPKTTAKPIKGSGGFFFWETFRGYNFFAVDSLCADSKSKLYSDKLKETRSKWGVETWGPYIEQQGNVEGSGDTRYNILEAQFASEINMMESLRKGKYSSLITFYNVSTGQYEEYVYSLKNAYDNMAHLGGQESLDLIPVQNKELSEYPTRIMSMLIDHELWYNEPGVASPEPSDKADKPTKFADWSKYYMAQSLARYEILKNQVCSIVIPGNPRICAGDRIDIRLMSKLPKAEASKEIFDRESSGVYLIKSVSHHYDAIKGTNGKFATTLYLVRDSFGIKGDASSHGN